MQIMNCAKGPRILSSGTEVAPGATVTIDDKVWGRMRNRNVVQHWLTIGELKELSPFVETEVETADAEPQAPASGRGKGRGRKAAKAADDAPEGGEGIPRFEDEPTLNADANTDGASV